MRLVSIVGDDISRLVPVIYAYRKQITEHILVCDSASASHAKRLAGGLKKFATYYQHRWKVRIEQIDASDLLGVVSSCQQEIGALDDVTLAITDAYPMLALLLGRAVHAEGGDIISYDHFSNKIHFLDSEQQLTCTIAAPRLNLKKFLMLMGYKILSRKNRKNLSQRRVYIERLFADPYKFNKLRLALLRGEQVKHASYLDQLDTLDALGVTYRGIFLDSQAKALAGDLLEEYVFWLCEGLGMDDIAMGVHIDFDEQSPESDKGRHITNEFDILIMHQNRIYTIECKYSNKLNGLGLVYKYDSIMDYFGNASKAILLNLSDKPKEPYLQMHTSSSFGVTTLRRAKRSNLHVYHETVVKPKEFKRVVREFFGL